MPTYEYVCTDCANQWEEVQKISESAIEVCPKCSKSTAKRQISGGNFILKGGGWYADLYASTPKKGGDAKEKGGSSGSSSEGSSSSSTASSETSSSSASASGASPPAAAASSSSK